MDQIVIHFNLQKKTVTLDPNATVGQLLADLKKILQFPVSTRLRLKVNNGNYDLDSEPEDALVFDKIARQHSHLHVSRRMTFIRAVGWGTVVGAGVVATISAVPTGGASAVAFFAGYSATAGAIHYVHIRAWDVAATHFGENTSIGLQAILKLVDVVNN
mmetsp:Transcript_25175/g.34612  ORF Transcript_25175/g.34612 Transcript_25175/m.34612 type:complete len:159 (+) Transcript_25175:246-722(+)